MAVKFTKPEINVREKLAELDKPSGVAGEAMLRAETPQEQQALIGVGRRNLIINGGFDVWQRGTSITTTGNGYGTNYTSDRWIAYFIGTYSKQSTSLPNGDYVNYFRGVLGAGGSNRLNINQVIENGNSLLSGKNVTVSFWLKCNLPNKSILLRLLAVNNSTFSSYAVLGQDTFHTDTAWKKYEITVPCINDTANISSRPHAILELDGVDADWGNGDTFEFAQAQVEIGKVATPFEHRSYGEELALCQRYFCTGFPVGATIANGQSVVGTNDGINGWVAFGNNVARSPYIHYPVEMRASPSVTLYSVGGMASGKWGIYDGSAWQAVGSTAIDITNKHFNVRENNSAFTMGIGKAYLLKGQWTASSEL